MIVPALRASAIASERNDAQIVEKLEIKAGLLISERGHPLKTAAINWSIAKPLREPRRRGFLGLRT
jgi:hypothetical protein